MAQPFFVHNDKLQDTEVYDNPVNVQNMVPISEKITYRIVIVKIYL